MEMSTLLFQRLIKWFELSHNQLSAKSLPGRAGFGGGFLSALSDAMALFQGRQNLGLHAQHLTHPQGTRAERSGALRCHSHAVRGDGGAQPGRAEGQGRIPVSLPCCPFHGAALSHAIPAASGALTPPCCSKEPLPWPARSGPSAPGSSPAVPGAGAARAGPRWSSEPSPVPEIFGRAPSALPAEREEPLLSSLLGIF